MKTKKPLVPPTLQAPFENETETAQLGGLTLENRKDRVSLYGDLDLTLDQKGLADAQALLQLLQKVVAHLESQPLPAQLECLSPVTKDSPF